MKKLFYQKGAAIIEFAIVLPLLLIITFGIIEFGILIYNMQIITNASREGARAGIIATNPRVPPTGNNSIDSVVQNYCSNHLITFGNQNSPLTIVTGYQSDADFRDELEVLVTYQYSFFLIPEFIQAITKLRNIEAKTVMRYE